MGIFKSIIDWFSNGFNNLLVWLVSNLPNSPLHYTLPPEVTQFLGYLNYFIPFGKIGNITLLWGLAIGLYYAVSVMLRWAKAIK